MDQEPETKICTLCNKEKPIKQFPFQYKKNYRYNQCSTCRSDRMNPEALKRRRREKKWKALGIEITYKEYEALVVAQDEKCAVCGQAPEDRELAVDHDHETGKVRALLCSSCNLGIGSFKDDPELMKKAAEYTAQAKVAKWSPKPQDTVRFCSAVRLALVVQ